MQDDLIVADPFALFGGWLDEAGKSEPNDANAMSLATVDGEGMPSVRIVLLKGFDARGFVFYTNTESDKGRQLLGHPKAALCFHWKSLRRQVRVWGETSLVTGAEADSYYHSRPRGSQVGAWASQQSRPLDSRATLERKVEELTASLGEGEIPRPAHWTGFAWLHAVSNSGVTANSACMTAWSTPAPARAGRPNGFIPDGGSRRIPYRRHARH